MLLEIDTAGARPDRNAIARALLLLDPLALIDVDADAGKVRIDGRLTARQAVEALRAAGYESAPMPEDHVSGGSTCCGSCT